MSASFLERLQNGEILFHYAPLHSLLADWGKPLETHLSKWIIDNPEKYQEALVKSYEAGCTLGCTQTQAASPWRAETFGLRHRVRELNYKSARLAREVTRPPNYVLALVSSTNPDFLQPLGSLSYQEVYDGYQEQISALLEGGIDLFIIAGNHLEEQLIAIRVARDLCDLPIISQNVYYTGKKGFRTMMGIDPAIGSARLEEAGVDVIGGSCGLMSDLPDASNYYRAATKLVREMRRACRKSVSIQPNAGMPQLQGEITIYPATPAQMAAEVEEWVCAGARLVGGCCGTNLDHYRAISKKIGGRKADQVIADRPSPNSKVGKKV
ncbi:MAG: homocysteine S-methyltransferase family protein [Acidobacteriota bacterium]